MAQARHTSLSLRTQLAGLTAAVHACDSTDYFATTRLAQQLSTLRTQLEKDQIGELAPMCDVAIRIAEVVSRDGQIGSKQALELIDSVLAHLCDTLSIERVHTQDVVAPAVSAPIDAAGAPAALPSEGPKVGAPHLKMITNRRLGEIMIQLSMLTPSQVEQALAHQRMTGCRFGEALIQMRMLPRDAVESALRMQGVRRAAPGDAWGGSR